jgi:crossover junction endodeoxyribonuclease RuvC
VERKSVARSAAAVPAAAPALRILGIDPGTVVLGWGIIEASGGRMRHIASGTVRPRGERVERVAAICAATRALCDEHRPAVVSLEQTFVGSNVQSAFRLGEARGAVMVAACGAGLLVSEYSPAQIKLAVAGSGRASKGQMQLMVARLLALADALATDEADALGAAICHAQAGQFTARLAAATLASFGGSGRGRRSSWRNATALLGRP